MLRRFQGLFLLLILGLGFFFSWQYVPQFQGLFYSSPCDAPLIYTINEVDPRFQLSREEFTKIAAQAAAVWNQAWAKPLLAQGAGDLTVSLVYDARQGLKNQIDSLEDNLKEGATDLRNEITQYETLSAAFKVRIEKFNQDIAHWNSQGGAPPEVYDRLIAEQQDLEKEAARLNNLARKLNRNAQQYNTQVGSLNKTVDTFNEALTQRPEEGIYSAEEQKIEIYFNNNRQELLHTLIHEFGHALGLGHIENPKAIMYPYSTSEVSLTPEDQQLLTESCRDYNVAQIAFARVEYYLDHLLVKENPN